MRFMVALGTLCAKSSQLSARCCFIWQWWWMQLDSMIHLRVSCDLVIYCCCPFLWSLDQNAYGTAATHSDRLPKTKYGYPYRKADIVCLCWITGNYPVLYTCTFEDADEVVGYFRSLWDYWVKFWQLLRWGKVRYAYLLYSNNTTHLLCHFLSPVVITKWIMCAWWVS